MPRNRQSFITTLRLEARDRVSNTLSRVRANTTRAFNGIRNQNRRLQGGFFALSVAARTVGRAIATVGATAAGYAVSAGTTIRAFGLQERAAQRLSVTLRNLGREDISRTVEQLEAVSQRLSDISVFRDQDILEAINQFAIISEISDPTELERYAEAILNVATVLRVDLVDAARRVGRGEGLEEVGVRVNRLEDGTVNLTDALFQLENSVAGIARIDAEGAAGSLDRMTRAVQELGEAIGEYLVDGGVLDTFNQFTAAIEDGNFLDVLSATFTFFTGQRTNRGFDLIRPTLTEPAALPELTARIDRGEPIPRPAPPSFEAYGTQVVSAVEAYRAAIGRAALEETAFGDATAAARMENAALEALLGQKFRLTATEFGVVLGELGLSYDNIVQSVSDYREEIVDLARLEEYELSLSQRRDDEATEAAATLQTIRSAVEAYNRSLAETDINQRLFGDSAAAAQSELRGLEDLLSLSLTLSAEEFNFILDQLGLSMDELVERTKNARLEAAGLGFDWDRVIEALASESINAFSSQIESTFENIVSGSQDAATAFEQGTLRALSSVASGFARYFAAQAIASLAAGQIQSAGLYTAASLGLSALSGSIGGAAASGAATGSRTTGRQTASSFSNVNRGTVEVYIEGGILDMTNPHIAQQFADAVQDVSGRDVVLRVGA